MSANDGAQVQSLNVANSIAQASENMINLTTRQSDVISLTFGLYLWWVQSQKRVEYFSLTLCRILSRRLADDVLSLILTFEVMLPGVPTWLWNFLWPIQGSPDWDCPLQLIFLIQFLLVCWIQLKISHLPPLVNTHVRWCHETICLPSFFCSRNSQIIT